MQGYSKRCMVHYALPWMDGGMDGWMNGWFDGWMDGWMDE